MNRLEKLKQIAKALSPDKVDFSAIDTEVNLLKKKLQETVNIQTVDDVSRKLKQFQDKINFQPLIDEINKIKETFSARTKELELLLKVKAQELIVASEERNVGKISSLQSEVNKLKEELAKNEIARLQNTENLLKQINEAKTIESKIDKTIETLTENFSTRTDTTKSFKETKKETEDAIGELRKELLGRISNLGGGSLNQQINVNSSVMSTRYADINFVSDTAIKWSATNDDTNKRVNLRASLISGGSGGAGTPGGSDTQVQFNDNNAFGGDAGLTYNKNTSTLTVGTLIIDGADISTANGATPIPINITTGTATSGNNNGADFKAQAGLGNGSGTGGGVNLVGGDGGITGGGGSANISAGLGGANSGVGGTISLAAGDAQGGNSDGGSFYLQAGKATGSGIPGAFYIRSGGEINGYLSLETSLLSAIRTATFPNKDGTVAYLSDISGSGITRTTSIISVSMTGGTATDYVYLANVGLKFTLPSAVGNNNLYTIKNISSSSVLVATTASETIDDSATALMPTKYESLSFISNNSIWGVV